MKNIILAVVVLAILAGGYYWYSSINSSSSDEASQMEAKATALGAVADLEFTYPTSPDGYSMVTNEVTELEGAIASVTLFNKKEYEEFQGREFPSEYPPAISIMAFANESGLSPEAWAEDNLQFSNIQMATGEVKSVRQAEAEGITYTIDGLYFYHYYVLAHQDSMYVLAGAYMNYEDKIHKDFGELMNTLHFR